MKHSAAGIRPANAVDSDLLAALHGRCFDGPEEETWGSAAIATLLSLPGGSAFLAVSASEAPAGLVIVRYAGSESEILTLGVVPEDRRTGHGRRLVDAAADEAQDLGAETLHLEVAADNAAALAFYERCDFLPVGRRRGYYRRSTGSVDAILLSRTLVS